MSGVTRSLFSSKLRKDAESVPAKQKKADVVSADEKADAESSKQQPATRIAGVVCAVEDKKDTDTTVETVIEKTSLPLSPLTSQESSDSKALQGFRTPHQTPVVLSKKQV